ncbi:MAG: phenylacetate--CoA ligase family protein, partial [Caldimicrobium sp.]
AYECDNKRLHFQEEYFLVEVINPQTSEPVSAYEIGELVITTLVKEAFPLIRFRTGDLVVLEGINCSCGNPYLCTSPILGRRDEVIIIRGLKISCEQIEKILLEILGEIPLYQILLEKRKGLEEALLLLALSERFFTDSYLEQEQLKRKIEEKLLLELSLPVEIKFVEKGSLQRKNGEIIKFIDKR